MEEDEDDEKEKKGSKRKIVFDLIYTIQMKQAANFNL